MNKINNSREVPVSSPNLKKYKEMNRHHRRMLDNELTRIYHKKLRILSNEIGEILDIDRSEKYWEIILGPWLRHLIGYYVANREQFEGAHLKEKGQLTRQEQLSWAPYSWDDFVLDVTNQKYIQLLSPSPKKTDHSQKLKNMIFESPTLTKNRVEKKNTLSALNKIKIMLAEAAVFYFKAVRSKRAKSYVVLDQNVISNQQLHDNRDVLNVDFNFFPRYGVFNVTKKILEIFSYKPINFELRNRLYKRLRDRSKDFDADTLILDRIIALTVPIFNFEYLNLLRKSQSFLQKRVPKAVVFSNTQYFKEDNKVLSAEWHSQGAQIIVSQHGAGYFLFTGYTYESHETSIADLFLTWGFNDPRSNKLRFPSITLASLSAKALKKSTSKSSNFIYVCKPHMSVCYDHLHIQKIDNEIVFNARQKLVNAISDEEKGSLLIRPYPSKSEHGGIISTRGFDETNFKFLWKDGLFDNVDQSSVIIVEGLSTAFFEALVKDVPVVLFIPQLSLMPLSKYGQSFFETLRFYGLLFEDEMKLNEFIKTDFSDWWSSPFLSEGKQFLRENFAYTENDWASRFNTLLVDLQ